MAFSVDAWGQPAIQPVQTPVLTAAVQPQGGKPQLTPTQDIETSLVSKWQPVIVPPTFHRY